MQADLKKACRTDRIADTVDYRATEARVIAAAEASSCFLVEDPSAQDEGVSDAQRPVSSASFMLPVR